MATSQSQLQDAIANAMRLLLALCWGLPLFMLLALQIWNVFETTDVPHESAQCVVGSATGGGGDGTEVEMCSEAD